MTNRPKESTMTVRESLAQVIWKSTPGATLGNTHGAAEAVVRWLDANMIGCTNCEGKVLLDPAALPSVDDLRAAADMAREVAHLPWGILDHLADLIEAQTTPPVAEPVDGSTVRDFKDVEWAKSRVDGRWCSLRASGNTMPWDELVSVRSPLTVLSAGREGDR